MLTSDWLRTLEAIDHLVVGYSGGMDSHVLLRVIAQLPRAHAESMSVTAIHVNHHLSKEADAWEIHCIKTSEALGINCVSLSVDVLGSPLVEEKGLEAAARTLRYEAIKHWMHENLPSNSALLLAHHANDQAETLLLQLMRGAGPKGLAAMPNKKCEDNIQILRPFLNQPYDEIKAYATQHALAWIEDLSNQDTRYDRNFIRHDILPSLMDRWPSAVKNIHRSAKHCAQQTNLLEQQLQTLLPLDAIARKALPLSILQSSSEQMKGMLMRTWLSQLGISMPSSIKLKEALRQLCEAKSDKNPVIIWGKKHSLRRYQQMIYYVPIQHNHAKSDHSDTKIMWDIKAPLDLGNGKLLLINHDEKNNSIHPEGSCPADGMKVTVCFRQGGEKIQLSKGGQRHTLKQLMQTWQIPPWDRSQWPLIMIDDELVAIPSFDGKKCHIVQAWKSNPEYHWLSGIRFLRK